MTSYLALAPKYIAAHKKKTRLTILSVAISVGLITGIFSMVDALMDFEKLQMIRDYGNYHMAVIDATPEEVAGIRARVEVNNTGNWKDFGSAAINDIECRMAAIDENFAPNFNIEMLQGNYPTADNEVMLEHWAAESPKINVQPGGKVTLKFEDTTQKEYIVSGIYNDLGNTKAEGVPGVMISMNAAKNLSNLHSVNLFLVEFKENANMIKADEQIRQTLSIPEERIDLNNHLLAVLGQSTHKASIDFYTIGAILFTIVLVAGVVMIYNTFNISVMERVRQFGLLRCIGASAKQIKKLIRREAFSIAVRALPLGLASGLIMTLACSALLKYLNTNLFAEIKLFTFSITGIGAGIIIGFATVFIASLMPAKKASKVSPVNAVTGSTEIKLKKNKKQGLLTKLLHAEIALGINNAVVKKKTLVLMSLSMAIGIMMFLGFNVFVNFLHSSLKTTKANTPDVSLISTEQGFNADQLNKFGKIQGVKGVYGRMYADISATFDAARLAEDYKTRAGEIKVLEGGLFDAPEDSLLVSYDQKQLNWAKEDLVAGKISEKELNDGNGVISVVMAISENAVSRVVNFQIGDKVYFEMADGEIKPLTVMGILWVAPFSNANKNLATFITTEKLFTELTGKSNYSAIDIQMNNRSDEQPVDAIKSLVDANTTLLDLRQKNTEINQTFFTFALFIYGFVAVIAIISILNIINTMNTGVASKMRYLGVMRAVGMTGKQLHRMVLAEAATYSIIGCVFGAVSGVWLQKVLVENLLTSFSVAWKFPTFEVVGAVIFTLLAAFVSTIGPIRRIRSQGISEVIESL